MTGLPKGDPERWSYPNASRRCAGCICHKLGIEMTGLPKGDPDKEVLPKALPSLTRSGHFCFSAASSKLGCYKTQMPCRLGRQGICAQDWIARWRSLREVLPKALPSLTRSGHFCFSAASSKLGCYKTKMPCRLGRQGICAQDWIRTSTPVKALRPEHSASTNFATWAFMVCFFQIGLQI